jgi:hypothetical protein
MDEHRAKRRLFDWEGRTDVPSEDENNRREVPLGQLALGGPDTRITRGHLPLRGDLAHVRLAGRYFVPHYAAPMPHRVTQTGAVLRAIASADGDELCVLEAGATFDVLDMSGGWCWGELGEDGPVGYVEQTALEVH